MDPVVVLPLLIAIGVIFVMVPVGLAVYAHYRRQKLVRCPETDGDAAVLIAAGRAGIAAAFGGRSLRAVSCSLWPERRACGQACLRGEVDALVPAATPPAA